MQQAVERAQQQQREARSLVATGHGDGDDVLRGALEKKRGLKERIFVRSSQCHWQKQKQQQKWAVEEEKEEICVAFSKQQVG